jgi:hypothetical protein
MYYYFNPMDSVTAPARCKYAYDISEKKKGRKGGWGGRKEGGIYCFS